MNLDKKQRTIVAVVGGLLLLLVAWRFVQAFSGGGSRARGRGGGTSRKIVVDTVKKDRLVLDYELVADVRSSQTVDVIAETTGRLEEVPFLEGDEVHKGDLVAKIDDADALANLYKVKSDLANARFTYYQLLSQRELTGVEASSQVTIAEADLNAARAGVEKNQAAYRAALTQGKTSVAQAAANLERAKANLRQAEVDFNQSKVKYERTLGLQRQGFVSRADVQDAYADVLSKHATVDARKAEVVAAQTEVDNSQEQAKRDAVSAKADILTARTQQASADASLDRAVAGTSRSRSFEQQLLAQQSLVDAAEAEFKGAELRLQDTSVRSPIDGYVSARRIDSGTVVNTGDVILTIQGRKEVWVVAALPQEIYSYVTKGASCKVKIDGMRDKLFEGYIFQKDSAVDPNSRQFNIRVKIDDPESTVKPGMFARVLLQLGPQDPQPLIPSAALLEPDDEQRTAKVYKVVDSKVQLVDIRFGRSDGERTLVREGLEPGDQVVVQTAFKLEEGQEVEAHQAEPSATPTPTSTESR